MNLTNDTQYLHSVNCKTLRKEIKEDLNKQKNITRSWIGILTVVKMSVPPKFMYRFNAIPIKIPAARFVGINKLILKPVQKVKETKIAKTTVTRSIKLESH